MPTKFDLMATHNSTHTKDFESNDTVRTNPYMKKCSNQKHQCIKRLSKFSSPQIIMQLKSMDLNSFKNIYEDSITSNQSLDQIVLKYIQNPTMQPQTQSTDPNADQSTDLNADNTDQSTDPKNQEVNNDVISFAMNEPINTKALETEIETEIEPELMLSDVDQGIEIEYTKDGSGIVKKINGVRIIEPNFKTLLNATKEKYKQRSDEIKMLDLAFDREYKKGVLFQGGSGVGKTLLCLYYATIRKQPCIFLSCHSGITKDELVGSYQLVDNNSAYVLGEIIQAIVCANNSPNKRAIIILDELNCLTSDTQKILNEMLRFKDGITIAELGIKYRLKPDCKILVLATANPLSYQGTNELNAELESRLEIIEVPDLTSDELRDLINTDYNLDSEKLENLIRLKEMIVEANNNNTLDKGFDTREFVKTIDQYTQLLENKYSENKAMIKAITSCLYGKFSISDDEDQKVFVKETIESTLGIEPTDLNWFNA